MRYPLTTLALGALLLAGCGGGSGGGGTVTGTTTDTAAGTTGNTVAEPSEKPEDAMKAQIDLLVKGQWSRLYERLHPGQQALVSFEQYQTCVTENGLSGVQMKFQTVEVFDDRMDVPGVPEKSGKAVTFKLTVGNGSTSTLTRHVILHQGKWYWTYLASDLEKYGAGSCPSRFSSLWH
jgi:hypothetical protein